MKRIAASSRTSWGVRVGVSLASMVAAMIGVAGCAPQGPAGPTATSQPAGAAGRPTPAAHATPDDPADKSLRDLATAIVRHGVQYPENPVVRAQGVEACEQVLGAESLPLVRNALKDEHAGVRFAACMTLGRLKDTESVAALRGRMNDPDASVRAGVYFALERLGDSSHRKEFADLLRRCPEPAVRRNAALALGALRDPKTLPLLTRAARSDLDEGVRLQALEGLAVLGDKDAIDQFLRFSIAGRSFRQPFALMALRQVKDDRVIEALRSRLDSTSSPYVESQLAAARSLGAQGYREGFNLAMNSLEWNQPQADLPDDPPANQVMRVRSMAALALGEIGDRRALKALTKRMQTPDDPRVQLAAATAILMILNGPT